MILHVQPVPDVLAIPINRQRLSVSRIQDHQRNQFLGKLERSIIVRTIRGQRWQSVSVVVGADEVIGRRLRCCIRAVWSVLRRFAKGRVVWSERSVYLVSRHVQETKLRSRLLRKGGPVSPRFFQQGECAVNVGANEIVWPPNRPVHMAFRRKMHDCIRLMFLKQLLDQTSVCNVAMNKLIAPAICNALQIVQIPCVGQLVQVDH